MSFHINLLQSLFPVAETGTPWTNDVLQTKPMEMDLRKEFWKSKAVGKRKQQQTKSHFFLPDKKSDKIVI